MRCNAKRGTARAGACSLLLASLGAGVAVANDEGASHRYTVVLSDPSVGRRIALSRGKGAREVPRRAAASSYEAMARAVARSQEPVVEALESHGVVILGSVRNVLNAVFVRATPAQAERLRAVAGVRRVVPSRSFEPQLDAVAEADLVRLRAARLRPGGDSADGAGMRIAIIDSGLDFAHEAFLDDSLPPVPGFPKGRPDDLRYASPKVIAVRTYTQLQNSGQPETSTPDDESPQDLSGHGTAVAMIAAGRSVELPGGRIAEGVAPKAYLGVYKVIGTPGISSQASSEAMIAAIDDAVSDGMDILSISVVAPTHLPWLSAGADCGSADPAQACDPVATAAQSAVTDFGRIVVAAAGNAGDDGLRGMHTGSTIASPATAPAVIAVGATQNARRVVQRVRAGGTAYPALTGSGPAVGGTLQAPAALASAFGNPLGCDPYPQDSLAGRIVLVRRGECRFADKVELADWAGALGVVVADSAEADELLEMASLEDTDIPAFFVSAADGDAMEARAGADPGTLLTLDSAPQARAADWTQVAEFSSRGPSPGLLVKPDMVAPGEWIYSAAARPPWRRGSFRRDGYQQRGGTSIAAPFVAGAAALVWQKHPEMTAGDVKSALVNTARQAIFEAGATARVSSVGGGLLDIERALSPVATVQPPTVSFGPLPEGPLTVSQPIVISNPGPSARSYAVKVIERDRADGTAVTVGRVQEASFALAPGEFAEAEVALEGRRPEPGSYEGYIELTDAESGERLRVPYLFAVGEPFPDDAFAVSGADEDGLAGLGAVKEVAAKYVDRFGVPVAGLPVTFSALEDGVRILEASASTDRFGLARARVEYGPAGGVQTVVAAAGGLEVPFYFEAWVPQPQITDVLNTGGMQAGRPLAPGSVATVLGSGFSDFAGGAGPTPLPVALKSASVSFDFPELNLSMPARLFWAGWDEIEFQVPWELEGLNFAYMKVRVMTPGGASFASPPVTVDLAATAPGIFLFDSGGGEPIPDIIHADELHVTAAYPAAAGEPLTVFMTGNGPLVRPVPSGEAAGDYIDTVHRPTVSVGGIAADVRFSDASPGLVGVYQVEFVVPHGLPAGSADLQVTVHGVRSNVVKLPLR